MPIFEYKCRDCRTKFERLVRAGNGAAKVKCPKCQGARTDKLLSTFAARSSGRNGETKSGGGKSCGSCRATSCRGCH
jgi:putative FmdB family regulatory protein